MSSKNQWIVMEWGNGNKFCPMCQDVKLTRGESCFIEVEDEELCKMVTIGCRTNRKITGGAVSKKCTRDRAINLALENYRAGGGIKVVLE